MHPGTLFGLDPFGWEVGALCALAAAVLVGLIAGGFVLLARSGRASRATRELGLLALWRLDRALRMAAARKPATSPGGRGGTVGPSLTLDTTR